MYYMNSHLKSNVLLLNINGEKNHKFFFYNLLMVQKFDCMMHILTSQNTRFMIYYVVAQSYQNQQNFYCIYFR